jgi:hypothetical protein
LYFVDDFSLRYEKDTFDQDPSDSTLLRSFDDFDINSHPRNLTFGVADFDQLIKIPERGFRE